MNKFVSLGGWAAMGEGAGRVTHFHNSAIGGLFHRNKNAVTNHLFLFGMASSDDDGDEFCENFVF